MRTWTIGSVHCLIRVELKGKVEAIVSECPEAIHSYSTTLLKISTALFLFNSSIVSTTTGLSHAATRRSNEPRHNFCGN